MHEWPAYSDYAPTSLPWPSRIPSHWRLLRNGQLFSERIETGFPDLPILEVSLRTGVTIRDLGNTKRKQMMSQREKYKRAKHGDIAYNMMRMWQGAVGVAPVDGLISPAYVVARPHVGTDSHYFNYLFGTATYKAEVNKYSRGIVADRNRLYWDNFKQMQSIVPPSDEQTKIAAYLRAQDRQIAKVIRGKRRLIELLNEQKQIIIHRAVTRGLNPDVRFRPSGIAWLEDVPAHWEVRPLKAMATVQFSGIDKHSNSDELAVQLCNYTDVYKNDFITEEMSFMQATATEAEVARFTLRVGDVLIPSRDASDDDILDAFAALWTAQRIYDGTAERISSVHECDEFGVPMQMWA